MLFRSTVGQNQSPRLIWDPVKDAEETARKAAEDSWSINRMGQDGNNQGSPCKNRVECALRVTVAASLVGGMLLTGLPNDATSPREILPDPPEPEDLQAGPAPDPNDPRVKVRSMLYD